jgi:hypothetical protein
MTIPTVETLAASCLLLAACSDRDPGTGPGEAGTPAGAAGESSLPEPSGQEPGDVPPVTSPDFEIVPPAYDLGVLDPLTIRDLTVEVFNRSDSPLSITHVSTECKCVSLEFDRGPIAQGSSAKVYVRIEATTAGQRTSAAVIHLSDRAHSKVRVPIHYVTVPNVLLQPKQIMFMRVLTGETHERTLEVTLHLPDAIQPDPKIEPFVAHDLPIELRFDPPRVTEAKGGMRDWKATLHVVLHADQPIPAFESQIVFQAKEPGQFRTEMVPVRGEVVPAWYFERGVLAFGVVDVGAPKTMSMRFFYPGEAPPEIVSLTTDRAELTATHEFDPENRCLVVSVTCLAGSPGRCNGEVSLLTSLSPVPDRLQVNARAK